MNPEQTTSVQCPYCWEQVELIIDCSQSRQQYIEDCSVCCQPMMLGIEIDDHGALHIDVARGND